MNGLRAGLAVTALLIAAGCGGADTFSAKGTLTLNQPGASAADSQEGAFCVGFQGFADIAKGTQVVVTDAAGKSVGVGSLDAGSRDSSGDCVFPFRVSGIESSSGIYSIEVAHRGKAAFKKSDAKSIAITLG